VAYPPHTSAGFSASSFGRHCWAIYFCGMVIPALPLGDNNSINTFVVAQFIEHFLSKIFSLVNWSTTISLINQATTISLINQATTEAR